MTSTQATPKTITLYHGTDLESAERILKDGFRGGFLTSCLDQAGYYAETAAEEFGQDDGDVIEIDALTSDLAVDFPSIEEPLTFVKDIHDIRSDNDWHEMFDTGELSTPEESDWEAGLSLTNTVRCTGTVGASEVRRCLS